MADDKDNPAPDPWANIESGADAESGDGFSFSLDGIDADAPAADDGEAFSFTPADSPASADDDAFFALEGASGTDQSLNDAAGDEPVDVAGALPAGFSLDDPAEEVKDLAGDDQAFASEEIVGDWLSEAAPAAGEAESLSFGEAESPEAVSAFAADAPQEGAHESADDDPFSFVAADREGAGDLEHVETSLLGGSSSIDIGTGESGIVSSSDIIPVEEAAEEGFPGVDFGDAPGVDGGSIGEDVGDFAAPVADMDPTADWPEAAAEEQPADEFGFAAADDAVESLAVGAAAGAATAVAAAKPSRPVAKAKPQKQSGIGQMIGVVLGGLMALPITYAILIWGFQKDPFKLTKSLPKEVAFLLPAKFQPVARPAGGPKITGGPSLDDVANVPVPEPEMPKPESPPQSEPAADATESGLDTAEPADEPVADTKDDGDDLFVEEPKPAEPVVAAPPPQPPAPPPLDLSGLESAVAAASEALDAVVAVEDAADPSRKKLLVTWYKHLAKVGEELALLETVAADTGRPLDDLPDAVKTLYGKIAGTDALADDLKRLCRDWVTFRRRPADGVMLVAAFDESRKVGPYWSSSVSLEQADGSTKTVSVISRVEPKAQPGDRVAVIGVVFEDDVVWAADCRKLAAESSASVDDLF